ncbi:uncharacterized protein RAG0_09207 [Rhynchosporium agropyri]|uniref:SET domain-containing protein n=1 Tax=Rhynchosporium agropyri TaxID=914238 RepID=A0A1E1KU97_9HELO|nr:uncharacterized protein RAG0_09207 [Rhynchosporium agropyri]
MSYRLIHYIQDSNTLHDTLEHSPISSPHLITHHSLQSPQSMIEVRAAGVAGLGVFAKTLIPRGTRIFSERSLLTLHRNKPSSFYPLLQRLSAHDRDVFMSLSAFRTRETDVMRWAVAGVHTLHNAFMSAFGLFGKNKPTGSDSNSDSDLNADSCPKRNSLSDHVSAISIFRSNSFNIGRNPTPIPVSEEQDIPNPSISHALFPQTARINHSCLPNAQGNYNPATQKFNVHATRDIERGEEVKLNYLMEEGGLRRSRMERLREGYGFDCKCPACDFGQVRGRRGEERRLKMVEKLKGFVVAMEGRDLLKDIVKEVEVERELEATMAYIELFESEGIAGRELSNMCMKAAELNLDICKHQEALRLAEQALQLDEDCLGTDHLDYKKNLEIVQGLKKGLDENILQHP